MSSAASSGDSTGATTQTTTGAPARVPSRPRPEVSSASRESTLGVFALLLAFRIVNSLTLRTLFVPDEHYQSLEPAWQIAFGKTSGAWITWEWRTQLRSSLNPELFAAIYLAASEIGSLCGLSQSSQAELLVAAPKVTQAVFAALLDFYTWKIAERTFGRRSLTAFTALALSICSPWQWFCSTRTLSNCLETTITSIAVYYWPWESPSVVKDEKRKGQPGEQVARKETLGRLSQTRLSLLLAAFACIFRPTNGLIWLAISIPTLWQISTRQRYILIREILVCGSAVVACSVVADRLYYQVWTFPPVRFLYFNIAQSLAVFYGTNRWDYYLTEGLPLLLTTALPSTIAGIVKVLRGQTYLWFDPNAVQYTAGQVANLPEGRTQITAVDSAVTRRILTRLTWTSIFVTLVLSLISHKEVRFLYPILPFLHVIASGPLTSFILRARNNGSWRGRGFTPLDIFKRRAVIIFLLLNNLAIAYFASQVHQRGVIDVLSYLRHKHEARINIDGISASTTVAFLMPCHSTPWRSHLVYSNISAWALTCEPPIDVPLSERSFYLDEADQFYIEPGPAEWLKQNMEPIQSVSAGGSRSGQYWAAKDPSNNAEGRRPWPQNLVFFAQLEDVMRDVLEGSRYRKCWKGFNSYFHDDWRRKGDVVVWCLK